MKFLSIAVLSTIAFSQLTSAQVSSCAAQNVLSTCLSNQDIYLKTCIDTDYACLCKWHTAKLSCYDNCPQDLGRASSQGLKDTFCSIARTYNTTTISSSAGMPSVVASTNLPSNAASAAMPSSSTTNSTSSISMSTSNYHIGQGVLMLAAGVTTWFLI